MKRYCLHPTWEENFAILIYDFESDVLHIRIFDYNTFTPDELIGECTVPLIELKDCIESSLEK